MDNQLKRNTPEHVAALDDQRAVLYRPANAYYLYKNDPAVQWIELTGFTAKYVFNWSNGWHICFEQCEEATLFKLAFGLRYATRKDQRF